MPWQAQLFIGEVVRNYTEVNKIYSKLGGTPPAKLSDAQEFYLDEPTWPSHTLVLHGKTFEALPYFYHEAEGGRNFPNKEKYYTDAAVVINLTDRYSPAILDQSFTDGGRPEPFIVNLDDTKCLLDQVKKWWPEAQVLIWNIWY